MLNLVFMLPAIVLALLIIVAIIGLSAWLWYEICYGFRSDSAEVRFIRRGSDAYLAFIGEIGVWQNFAWWKKARREFWVNSMWLGSNVWATICFVQRLTMRDGTLPEWLYVLLIVVELLIFIPKRYFLSKRNALKMRFALECGKLAVTELEQSNGKN